MLAATGIEWWIGAVKFCFAVLIGFYIPGRIILPLSDKKEPLTRLTLSLIIGLVLWSWQEFAFGYLGIRWLTYFYLAACLVIWLKNHRFKIPRFNLKKSSWGLILLVALGTFCQTMPLWKNGTIGNKNKLVFYGGNIEDNLWHASLTKSLVKHFPPFAPGLPGTLMKNYHYWSNMTLAGLIRTFKLPLFPTQFQYSTLFIAVLLGLVSISLARSLNLHKKAILFLVFFNYFGGDLIYLLLLIFNPAVNPFSMSSLEDGTKFLYNPPRAFAFVISLGGLTLFKLWQKEKKTLLGLISMLVLATTTGFKIYLAIFFSIGIGFLALRALLKKNWRQTLVFGTFFLLAAIIYLPTNYAAGGLVWAPFTIVNNFIVQPNLNLIRWEQARMIFLNDQKYLHNLIFEICFTTLFLTAILGTKILGLLQPPKYVKRQIGTSLCWLIYLGLIFSFFLGIFFIQATGGANTFNFLVNIFLFLSLLTTLSLQYWQTKLPRLVTILIAVIIAATLPRVIYETTRNLQLFFNPQEVFSISQEEQQIYQETASYQANLRRVVIDKDHYLGRNTPYVSLFIDRPLLVAGNGLLNHFRLPIGQEEKTQEIIFNSPQEELVARQIAANQVGFIILYDGHVLNATESAFFAQPIIKNNRGTLLKIDKSKLWQTLQYFNSLKKK